jgi:hypothetical protein
MEPQLFKKTFMLGKRHNRLDVKQKKLRKLQLQLFLSTPELNSEKSGKSETTEISNKLDRIATEIERATVFTHEYLDLTDSTLSKLENDLLDLKIKFYLLLKKYHSCTHVLTLRENKCT